MEEQVQKAYDLIEHGNYWRAEFIADRLIKSREEDVLLDALLIKGIAAYKSGSLVVAERTLQQALEIDPNATKAQYHLASLAYDKGDFLSAKKYIDTLLQNHPEQFDYLALKVEVELFLQNKETALQTIEKILSLDPSLFQYKWDLATIKLDLGRYDEAIREYEQLLKWEDLDHSQECDLLNNIGFSYWKKGSFYNAKLYLEKAFSLDENHAFVLDNLGMVYADLGDTNKGIELIKRALRVDRSNSYAYKNLGLIYYRCGEYKKALSYLEKALEYGFSLHYDDEVELLIEKIDKQ